MILLVHPDGRAEVVDAATCEALAQAVSRQLELREVAPDLAKVTAQLQRLGGLARQEPTGTASRSAVREDGGMHREWLTVAEAAAELGVSRRTIERRVAAGELPSVTIGRARRIARADLELRAA